MWVLGYKVYGLGFGDRDAGFRGKRVEVGGYVGYANIFVTSDYQAFVIKKILTSSDMSLDFSFSLMIDPGLIGPMWKEDALI